MLHILLVDDDDLLRKALSITLTKLGHVVTEARNGNEALTLFRAEPPDLVVTDIVMPDREGLETITALRRADPEVKIIAMSGGGRGSAQEYLQIARQLGARRTLTKPFSQQELAAAIADVCGG